MSERTCIRGCTVRDSHYAACVDFGKTDGATCKGCVLVVAREGAMICERCYERIRRHLDDASDLVAHLRSIADPTKAAVYDRVMVSSSKPAAPAPVSAELIDASADVVRTLRDWAEDITGEVSGYRLPPGAAADEAFDACQLFAGTILDRFDQIANSIDAAAFGDAILLRHDKDPEWWSIADVAARWPLDDRARWAINPCPTCDKKTIRVTPARRTGQPIRYTCTACDWFANSNTDAGLWGDVFAEPIPTAPEKVRVITMCQPCTAGTHNECARGTCGCVARIHDVQS